MSTDIAAPEVPRLKQRYRDEIVAGLREEFGHENVNQVARVTKIVVNMGVGDAAKDSKLIEGAIRETKNCIQATLNGLWTAKPKVAETSRGGDPGDERGD